MYNTLYFDLVLIIRYLVSRLFVAKKKEKIEGSFTNSISYKLVVNSCKLVLVTNLGTSFTARDSCDEKASSRILLNHSCISTNELHCHW